MKPCTFIPKTPKTFLNFRKQNFQALVFSQKKAFLIFPETETCTFQSKLEK